MKMMSNNILVYGTALIGIPDSITTLTLYDPQL